MRFAYADPPYIGQAKLYKGHPDYAGEVDHAALIARLVKDYPDGWALSCSVPSLRDILPLIPQDARICSWYRGQVPRPPSRIMWCWEPLIVRTTVQRRGDEPFVRDAVYSHQPAGFIGGEIKGQKPTAFCHWVFSLLGAEPDDEIDDLFPGSGAVGVAWDRWRNQLSIAGEACQRDMDTIMVRDYSGPEPGDGSAAA